MAGRYENIPGNVNHTAPCVSARRFAQRARNLRHGSAAQVRQVVGVAQTVHRCGKREVACPARKRHQGAAESVVHRDFADVHLHAVVGRQYRRGVPQVAVKLAAGEHLDLHEHRRPRQVAVANGQIRVEPHRPGLRRGGLRLALPSAR